MSLVIIKVLGSKIFLPAEKQQSYRVSISSLQDKSNSDANRSRVKTFVLSDSIQSDEKCEFREQSPLGQVLAADDLALFLDGPTDFQQFDSVTYKISFDDGQLNTSLEKTGLHDDRYVEVARACWKYSRSSPTKGARTLQIMNDDGSGMIGTMDIEYLIVDNPHAYNTHVPHPQWLKHLGGKLDAGHRGAGTGCRADLATQITENTIASFNYAARHGADMCELDVLCTADGIPVVYHNYSLTVNKETSKQIDKLTLEELRNLAVEDIHDAGCRHTETDKKMEAIKFEKDNAPFPSLKQVLQDVDKSCALNIEVKWPQTLPDGTEEAIQDRDLNDYVDRVLKCIFDHGCDRHIILSSLNTNIAILLRLKQSRYAVYFVTTGDKLRFNDPITKTIKNAIHFAQAFRMAGINPNAAYLNEDLVKYAHSHGLQVIAWGKMETAQNIKDLRLMGLDGIIYDKIDLIKPIE